MQCQPPNLQVHRTQIKVSSVRVKNRHTQELCYGLGLYSGFIKVLQRDWPVNVKSGSGRSRSVRQQFIQTLGFSELC